jgi:hypothetical protein
MRKLRTGATKATRVREPITATLHAVPPSDIAVLDSVPGIQYSDRRVTFTATDFPAAYRGLVKLVGVATRAHSLLLFEEVRSRPQGREILSGFSDRLKQRWYDVESDRWVAPAPGAAGTAMRATRQYHGFR